MENNVVLLQAASVESATNETVTTGTIVYPEAGVDTFVNHALPVIGWGFLSTFVVIGVLIGFTAVLNKIMSRFKKK